MRYPDDFVEAVKAAYPTWLALHNALDSGSRMVGRYLDDACHGSISNERVLAAETLEELQHMAHKNKLEIALYARWSELYREQYLEVR